MAVLLSRNGDVEDTARYLGAELRHPDTSRDTPGDRCFLASHAGMDDVKRMRWSLTTRGKVPNSPQSTSVLGDPLWVERRLLKKRRKTPGVDQNTVARSLDMRM
jgi:hypothetical protein